MKADAEAIKIAVRRNASWYPVLPGGEVNLAPEKIVLKPFQIGIIGQVIRPAITRKVTTSGKAGGLIL